jgi:uncharacterized membrane protein YecN with MAPEG domain
MVELNHAATYIVQGLCITLLFGRLTHAYGVSQEKGNLKIRKAGVLMTFTALTVGSLYLLSQIKLSA